MSPDELRAWRRERDEQRLAAMAAGDGGHARPQPVCIWVYHDRADEAEVHRRLESLGWTAFAVSFNEAAWSGEDGELVVRASRMLVPTLEAVTAMQDELIAALAGTSAEYSGWGPLESGEVGGSPAERD